MRYVPSSDASETSTEKSNRNPVISQRGFKLSNVLIVILPIHLMCLRNYRRDLIREYSVRLYVLYFFQVPVTSEVQAILPNRTRWVKRRSYLTAANGVATSEVRATEI